MLTIEVYDRTEQRAAMELPNIVVNAFKPLTFDELGYPSRIRCDAELFKYIDVMHELRFEKDYHNLLDGLTTREFVLLQDLTKSICKFSETHFGRKALARSSVLRSLNVLRHIRYIYGELRPRVLEVGPGCGYLGALLILEGYPYISTDVSQAFYLYQNRIWNYITHGELIELAEVNDSEQSLTSISSMPIGSAVHVPWWKFVQIPFSLDVEFDVIVCNHALCEMHPDSLGFLINAASQYLKPQDSPKVFLFEGWGCQHGNKIEDVIERFYRANFGMVHNDHKITVFVPRDSEFARGYIPMPVRIRRRKFFKIRNLMRRIVGEPPMIFYSYHPVHFHGKQNPLSASIVSRREAERDARNIGIKQVEGFYTDLLGNEDHSSPGERFWKFVRE
jgi:SAM-dependent methyltransferase